MQNINPCVYHWVKFEYKYNPKCPNCWLWMMQDAPGPCHRHRQNRKTGQSAFLTKCSYCRLYQTFRQKWLTNLQEAEKRSRVAKKRAEARAQRLQKRHESAHRLAESLERLRQTAAHRHFSEPDEAQQPPSTVAVNAVLSETPCGRVIAVDDQQADIEARRHAELLKLNNQQTGIVDGFVYIMTNPAWSDAVKVGSAINYNERLATYQTGDPLRAYRLVFKLYVRDRVRVERMVKDALVSSRISGEWFRIDVDQARTVIEMMRNRLDNHSPDRESRVAPE